jgi:hypothetical protein
VAGKYAPLLATLKGILDASGCGEEEFEAIAAEASDAAEGVIRSPRELIVTGKADQLGDLTDLILIGVIVTRYGMVMGNPFAGKE